MLFGYTTNKNVIQKTNTNDNHLRPPCLLRINRMMNESFELHEFHYMSDILATVMTEINHGFSGGTFSKLWYRLNRFKTVIQKVPVILGVMVVSLNCLSSMVQRHSLVTVSIERHRFGKSN